MANRKSGRLLRTIRIFKEVDLWNAQNPEGTRVIVIRDDGSEVPTTTRSAAFVLSGHTAVVMVDGIAGCYLLDRVRRVADATP